MILDLNFSPTFLAMIGLLFGAIIGSFLNVIIYRLPRIYAPNGPMKQNCS